jgi:nucleoside-diphosphate-sugar epimerase
MPDALAPERVLITGAGGFIGRHLLRALTTVGCHPVALTRFPEPLRAEFGAAVQSVAVDWDDPSSVARVIEAVRPSVVFHLAGVRVADSETNSATRNWQGNVELTENFLRALEATELRRFVALGTAEEYGVTVGPVTEDQPARPVTTYGRAKAEVTRTLLGMNQRQGFPVVALRPFTVYGPEQPVRMFIAQGVEHAVAGRSFAMTEGTQKRDLVYIDDVVRALIAAATAPGVAGSVINLGSGQPRPLREVAEIIWRLADSKAPLQVGARPAPPEELHDTWADVSRAKELLDWTPQVELEQGLLTTINWEREQGQAASGR